jgi:hypothetical protein
MCYKICYISKQYEEVRVLRQNGGPIPAAAGGNSEIYLGKKRTIRDRMFFEVRTQPCDIIFQNFNVVIKGDWFRGIILA